MMIIKVFLVLSVVVSVNGKPDILKLCVVGNPKLKVTHTTKYCDLLEKSKGSPVSCVYETDRLGCLSAVSNKKANFSFFDAEELYISALTYQNSVLVVGEIRDLKDKSYHFETVVVVRKSSNITSIQDLKGKKLCHPGLDYGSDWPYMFAQYFEKRIIPINCEKNLTVYEDRIKSTSDFFGLACKAGPWVMNPGEDARLKKKYWNLCGLCESGDCRVTEKYRGSGGSITCFKDGVGDILWAKYEDVKIHIGSEDAAESHYSFLCQDGTQMPFSTNAPCFWLARPWQVVFANRKSAINVQKILEKLGKNELSTWEINLMHLIEIYTQYIHILPVSRTPEDYLQSIPGYLSASAMSEENCKPKHTLRLCVDSFAGHQKCSSLSKAAIAFGIQPTLECFQKPNISLCLESVSKMETDVVIVPSDYFSEAILNFNLKTFLLESGDHFNNSCLISALVKSNTSMKLLDLKGKRACFTKANGIGWNGAIEVLRQNNFIESKCGYGIQDLRNFFGDVCVVDNNEKNYDLKLCCTELSSNDNADVKTMECLNKGGCDVAFVDINTFKGMKSTDFTVNDFKTICGTNKSIDCSWAWSYSNYLMTNKKISTAKAEEAYNLFFQLGQYFGKNFKKSTATFKIFGPFKQMSNILFKDVSSSFVPLNHWNHTNDYQDIVEKIKLCSKCSCLMFSKWMLLFFLFVLFNL